MRLWSLHPKYLDAKGLVALWRESLLAQKVLRGETKGYRHHPQLRRFKNSSAPKAALAGYLLELHREATAREYRFDSKRIGKGRFQGKIAVTDTQLSYEMEHLLRKLWTRDRTRYHQLNTLSEVEPHPIFKPISGEIADWEIVSK